MNIKKIVLQNPILAVTAIVVKLVVLALIYTYFFSSNKYSIETYCTYAQPPSSYFPMLVLTGQNKKATSMGVISTPPIQGQVGGDWQAAEKLYDYNAQYYSYMNYDPSDYPGYSITDTSFIDVSGYHIDLSSSYLTLTMTDTTVGTPNVTPNGNYSIEFYKNDKDCRSPNTHIYGFNRNNSPESANIVFNNPACGDTFSLTIKPVHSRKNGYTPSRIENARGNVTLPQESPTLLGDLNRQRCKHVGDVFPEQFTIDITFHINPHKTVTWSKKTGPKPLNLPLLEMNKSYAYSKPAFDRSIDGKIMISPNLVIDKVGYITDADDNEVGYVRNDIFDNNHWMLIFKQQTGLESITVNWKTGGPETSPSVEGGVC